MPMMICARNYTLRSPSTGYVIQFNAGEPKYVPPRCVSDALAVNILYAEGDGSEFHDNEDRKAAAKRARYELTGYMRECAIMHVIHEIRERNSTPDFTAGGRPKVSVLRAELNLPSINESEVSRLWDRYRDIIAAGEGLPSPPHLDDLLQVQRITAMADAVMYAEHFGADINGLSLADARTTIMGAISRRSAADLAASVDAGKLTED